MKHITCESLNHTFPLPNNPERVISLVSSATEALFAMGCGDRVAGVSAYCARYVRGLSKPVAGDYLKIDEACFKALDPDLVVVTTGIQHRLGRKLARKGWPVYSLPLPNSFYGILENNVILGALLNETKAGRALCLKMVDKVAAIRAHNTARPIRAYVELWFGKDMRTIGGRTFIDDLVALSGGETLYADRPEGYFTPNLTEIERMRPDAILFFSEPDTPIDFDRLIIQRGWDRSLKGAAVIESTVERGKNLIHDGPSFVETAVWLKKQLKMINVSVQGFKGSGFRGSKIQRITE